MQGQQAIAANFWGGKLVYLKIKQIKMLKDETTN